MFFNSVTDAIPTLTTEPEWRCEWFGRGAAKRKSEEEQSRSVGDGFDGFIEDYFVNEIVTNIN